MSGLADYTGALSVLVPGEWPTDVDQDARVTAVERAVEEHGRHAPREVVEDVAGADAFAYALASLAAWDGSFSQVVAVEYPVDDTSKGRALVDPGDFEVVTRPAGKYLHFLADRPATGESFRVTYTAPHEITATSCTVSSGDARAVQALAAAHLCEILAAYYAQSADPMISADSVDHSSRSANYAAQARAYRAQYERHVGASEDKPRPVSRVADQDVDYPGGADRLTHPRRWR